MAEISKIDIIKVDAKLKSRKTQDQQSVEKSKFEDQLLKTVKKLESMENEIDAMIESSGLQVNNKIEAGKSPRKELLNNIDNVVENFSAAGKSSLKTAKNVASQYGAMNNNDRAT